MKNIILSENQYNKLFENEITTNYEFGDKNKVSVNPNTLADKHGGNERHKVKNLTTDELADDKVNDLRRLNKGF